MRTELGNGWYYETEESFYHGCVITPRGTLYDRHGVGKHISFYTGSYQGKNFIEDLRAYTQHLGDRWNPETTIISFQASALHKYQLAYEQYNTREKVLPLLQKYNCTFVQENGLLGYVNSEGLKQTHWNSWPKLALAFL